MAYAAQLAGEAPLCDELIAETLAQVPMPEDLLLFAQIANLRSNPGLALERLEASAQAPGERNPGFTFELEATRGRALRLLGRREEARKVLEAALDRPESESKRLGPKLHVDLGHLAAEEGDFETSARHFERALELDPGDPEAKHGRSLTERRVAWRTEVTASAEARVEAARAEAEAMRRSFSAREGELDALRRELERLKAAQREAEQKAARAEEEARKREAALRAEQESRVREELFQREIEIEGKARENVERALGPHAAACPPALAIALKVAETTFQKALYTQLPAAAVAVLFAGVLERALYLLFVERFRLWLKAQGKLSVFLKAAVRERRGTRVEYFDHFVEAFDEERPGRAPSMGEVGRVLDRRKEPYLAAFDEFLSTHYPRSDAFWEELVAFVMWAKEKLRDPVAHGRGIDLGYDELRRFREQLLFSFGKTDRGVLAALLG
jgi:tetratricopeptide (TPR) repeat protein